MASLKECIPKRFHAEFVWGDCLERVQKQDHGRQLRITLLRVPKGKRGTELLWIHVPGLRSRITRGGGLRRSWQSSLDCLFQGLRQRASTLASRRSRQAEEKILGRMKRGALRWRDGLYLH